MESFFTRFKNVLVLVAILLAQTIGLAVQVRRPAESGAPDGSSVTLIRYWAVLTITPLERLFHGFGYNVRQAWFNYIDLRHTRQQNYDLQQQIARLRIEQSALSEDAIQGHRLQALLDFQQHYVASTVAAQVIGTSGSDLSRILYIDKGAKDGLKPDQAVITPDGIVGKIRDVFPNNTSQVLLINDQTSGAGVLLASTRLRAILRGSPTGQIMINNLTPDSRIKVGEQVLTSGGDLVYPRGLPVGTIESIKPDPDHQPYTLIQLYPAANLNQLEEVLVITGTQAALPAVAQHDLALGAATAEAQAAAKQLADQQAAEAAAKPAAQIVADRLPSLHDAETTDTIAPTPAVTAANPGGVVPKPLPTVHPDRYTQGSTPPASDLKPGAAGGNAATPTLPSNPKVQPQNDTPVVPGKPPKSPPGSTQTPNPQL
jgi:rod shape-determining protein MreC